MKIKLLLLFVTITLLTIGILVISDWKIALGVYLMLWGNNIFLRTKI